MRVYENLRTVVLTLLIGISLVLTGSLWFDNYHGLSSVMSNMISFFSEEIDLEDKRYIKEYIKPYKTIIANGDNGKWIYYVSSKASEDAFSLIKNIILDTDKITIEKAYENEWEELTNRKSIICEFADSIDHKIFSLALNNKFNDFAAEPVGIFALALTKTTTGGNLYINSSESIYRIAVDDIGEFDHILSNYSNSQTYAKFVKLEEIGITQFNTRKIKYKYDVLFPLSAKSSNRHKISKLISTNLVDNAEKIEEKVEKIFNKNNYIKFITDDNGYIYINDDQSLIKFHDGLIEYSAEKVNNIDNESTWIAAFNTALRFIDSISELKNLYLVSAEKNDNLYKFAFGTHVAEIPVIDSDKSVGDNRNAKIYIEVYNNSVVNYTENLTSYSEGYLAETYLSRFTHNILDDVLEEVPKKAEIKIQDIELAYDVATNVNLPVWITEYTYKDKTNTIITEAGKIRNY